MPAGETPASHLQSLTYAGMARRWPSGVPAKVQAQVEHELTLIAELRYEPYFLTVEDIVRYARTQGLLCQGRGSAVNSAVCYCLGITEVDPVRIEVMFERFISKERHEPPDIDVDFECGPLSRLVSIENAANGGPHRHQARWQVLGIEAPLPLGKMPALPDPVPMLRKPTEGEDIVADCGSLGLTLRRHPLALLRPALCASLSSRPAR